MADRLDRPVQLVTSNTYEGILQDFAEKQIDGAFLGSLVTVLAMDRFGAKVVVRPELPGAISTYHGVIFVREDSPITRLEQLKGHTIAMVKVTTAGDAFSHCVMMRLGMLDSADRPRVVWVGTHDDVAVKVMEGSVDVGAIKNLRLDALMRDNPGWRIRRLAEGKRVPSNALVLRGEIAEALGGRISQVLLEMGGDTKGRQTLEAMGVARFVPCLTKDYAAVYDMVECIEKIWGQTGIPGPIPVRPSGLPKPDENESPRCYDVNY